MDSPTYAAILTMVLLFAAGSVWAIRVQRHSGYADAEGRLLALVEELRAEVAKQRAVIGNLESKYRQSLISEADANRRIRELEGTLETVRARVNELEALNAIARPAPRYQVPLIHIVGNATFGEADVVALRKAEIRFKRLNNATRPLIENEMNRRRLDGTLYRWAIISAHMGKEGVLLEAANDTAPPNWWNEQLSGLEVVFLNGCSSLAVADALAGLVDVVVSLGEEVENRDAANFAYAFWRRMQSGTMPGAAFESAIREIPAVSEFADIRTG